MSARRLLWRAARPGLGTGQAHPVGTVDGQQATTPETPSTATARTSTAMTPTAMTPTAMRPTAMRPGPPACVRLRPDDVLLAIALGALLVVGWHWPGGLI